MKTSIRRGTRLFTKDGRKTGNAIVLGIHDDKIICESDFGKIFVISNLDNYWVNDNSTEPSDAALEQSLQNWYSDRNNNIEEAEDGSFIYLNQITCKYCNDTIQSKHRHDYVECKCDKVAVDGGTYYLRRTGTEYIEQSVIINRYEGEFK